MDAYIIHVQLYNCTHAWLYTMIHTIIIIIIHAFSNAPTSNGEERITGEIHTKVYFIFLIGFDASKSAFIFNIFKYFE